MRVPAKRDTERNAVLREMRVANASAPRAKVVEVVELKPRMCELCPDDDRKPAVWRLRPSFDVAQGSMSLERDVKVCDPHRKSPF